MKKLYFILWTIALPASVMATTYYSRASSAWTTPSTWSKSACGGTASTTIPGTGDNVVICSGYTVTVVNVTVGGSAAGDLEGLTINSGGELNMSGTLTVQNTGGVNGVVSLSGTLLAKNVTITGGAFDAVPGSTTTISMNFTNSSSTVVLNGNMSVGNNFTNSGNIKVDGNISVTKNFTNSANITGSGCILDGGVWTNSGFVFGVNGGTSAPCGNNAPLPITLTSFAATYVEETNSVLISWSVATQLNNKEFVIEKTTDGVNYIQIATLPGAGTTPYSNSYSITDNNPTAGLSYYRLEQIDIDGNATAFTPVSLSIGTTVDNSSIYIYPNPVGASTTLNYNSTNENPLSISIIDVTGRLVSSSLVNNIQMGENKLILNTSTLTPGIYFIRVIGGEKAYTLKIVR